MWSGSFILLSGGRIWYIPLTTFFKWGMWSCIKGVCSPPGTGFTPICASSRIYSLAVENLPSGIQISHRATLFIFGLYVFESSDKEVIRAASNSFRCKNFFLFEDWDDEPYTVDKSYISMKVKILDWIFLASRYPDWHLSYWKRLGCCFHPFSALIERLNIAFAFATSCDVTGKSCTISVIPSTWRSLEKNNVAWRHRAWSNCLISCFVNCKLFPSTVDMVSVTPWFFCLRLSNWVAYRTHFFSASKTLLFNHTDE